MRSVANLNVQSDNCHAWIKCFLKQALTAQRWLDHRVRLSDGKLIITQVQYGVFARKLRIVKLEIIVQGCVGIYSSQFISNDELRFIRKCAAAVQTTDVFLRSTQPAFDLPDHLIFVATRWNDGAFSGYKIETDLCGLCQRVRNITIGIAQKIGGITQQASHNRF